MDLVSATGLRESDRSSSGSSAGHGESVCGDWFAGPKDELMAAVLDAMVAAAISGAAVVRGTGVEAALAVESRALWKVKRLVTGEE